MDFLPDTLKSRLSLYTTTRGMENHHHPAKKEQLRQNASPAFQNAVSRSPLQRFNSPSRGFSAILHLVGLSSFAASFLYLTQHPNEINASYGWHFQYLTIIGLLLATVTFTLGILADLSTSPSLFSAKNLLSMCSTPLECLITLLYWTLRAIDPSLVVPADMDLPPLVDLSFHLLPALVLTLDLLLLSPPWDITILPSLMLSTTLAFAYWFWVEICHARNGFYPYPLFELLDTTQRMGLFAGSAVVMVGGTGVLKSLYWVVNGDVAGVVKREGGGL